MINRCLWEGIQGCMLRWCKMYSVFPRLYSVVKSQRHLDRRYRWYLFALLDSRSFTITARIYVYIHLDDVGGGEEAGRGGWEQGWSEVEMGNYGCSCKTCIKDWPIESRAISVTHEGICLVNKQLTSGFSEILWWGFEFISNRIHFLYTYSRYKWWCIP